MEANVREIKRDVYLNKLISRKENGLIKIITGIRRCGKSYLLDPLFKNYLLESGVKEDHIIKLELDKEENKKFRDSHELNEYIKSLIKDKNMYYILLDEIQMVGGFESVLNSFFKISPLIFPNFSFADNWSRATNLGSGLVSLIKSFSVSEILT